MARKKKNDTEKTRALVPRAGRSTAITRRDESDVQELVARAIVHVKRIAGRTVLAGAVEIGDYLLPTFFDNDVDLARKKGAKPVALERFFEQAPQMDISQALLRRCIPIAIQYHALPASVRDKLSVRQHAALLPVDDAREKARLADQAARRDLSQKQIEELVRARPDRPRRGRPPKTELEKAVPAARRVLMSALIESELSATRVRQIDPEVRERLVRDLRAIRERTERIADALQRSR